MSDTIEKEKEVTYVLLGAFGEGLAAGTIEPREDQQEQLEDITERVGKGEFHVVTRRRLPCGCIDGRCAHEGARVDASEGLTPNSAGGTETLMVADDLTTQTFASEDGTTLGAYRNAVAFMNTAYPGEVGGHRGDHAMGDASGCGANDKLEKIYGIIKDKPEQIRGIATALGATIDDDTLALIVKNAAARTQFSSGRELSDELLDQAGEAASPVLEGDHNEVIAVINKRFGTTLDREKLREVFDANYQAFNVDIWSFEEAARAISVTEEEAQQKYAAMVIYNIATTLALCGDKLRITVLE